jgi:hypothetical protein
MKSCKDSHRLPARCERLRRLLKLRRKKHRRGYFHADSAAQTARNTCIFIALRKLDNFYHGTAKLAADVHFSVVENHVE